MCGWLSIPPSQSCQAGKFYKQQAFSKIRNFCPPGGHGTKANYFNEHSVARPCSIEASIDCFSCASALIGNLSHKNTDTESHAHNTHHTRAHTHNHTRHSRTGAWKHFFAPWKRNLSEPGRCLPTLRALRGLVMPRTKRWGAFSCQSSAWHAGTDKDRARKRNKHGQPQMSGARSKSLRKALCMFLRAARCITECNK